MPKLLQAFRDGDEALIARDKLSLPPNETPTPEETLRVSVNRNVFFDTLEETTRLLQQATLRALSLIEPQRAEIQSRVDEFEGLYGGFNFRPYRLHSPADGKGPLLVACGPPFSKLPAATIWAPHQSRESEPIQELKRILVIEDAAG